ncbi:MAG: MBL fold metallo-hydrolase [Terracidiphilus sp.]|nr:MBL fold metallo-hydrolase [Terracidiphilus sp.]
MRFLSSLLVCAFTVAGLVQAQIAAPRVVAPGVWFMQGDAAKGYSNTAVIEMKDYLVVVDANYPGRARELIELMKTLSPKPVRYVFDTHAHGDHSYGNSTWTRTGATTLAFVEVAKEMNRYEPARWQTAMTRREDVRLLGETNVERPKQLITGERMVLEDETRRVELLHLGWGHTQGDGYVWLPKERILCTGDAAVNGPRNKLWDAYLENWPHVLEKAIALKPAYVLPGHGEMGGMEILTGQRQFLLDLYNAVKQQVEAGKVLADIRVELPEGDRNWIPRDLTWDIEAEWTELTHHQPADAVEHAWK